MPHSNKPHSIPTAYRDPANLVRREVRDEIWEGWHKPGGPTRRDVPDRSVERQMPATGKFKP